MRIPLILITLFTMPEECTADSTTWRRLATTDGWTGEERSRNSWRVPLKRGQDRPSPPQLPNGWRLFRRLLPSKDELRARVEQLERANTTLRANNREVNRAVKTAAARIAELEDQVAQLEQQVAQPSAPARAKRQRREVDDSVPPRVAVQEPVALDEDAETGAHGCAGGVALGCR
jgi:nitrogen fixation protein